MASQRESSEDWVNWPLGADLVENPVRDLSLISVLIGSIAVEWKIDSDRYKFVRLGQD